MGKEGDGSVAVVTIETPTLGNRSYLAVSEGWAVAIDVPRDIDRVEQVLDSSGVRLAAVLETHVHNDYLTGGLALARRRGVPYVVPDGPELHYDAVRIRDEGTVNAGPISVAGVETPGHTDAHSVYIIGTRGTDNVTDVFTGGSLLLGGTGRTDLLGADRAEALARAQHRSIRRLTGLLAPSSVIWPTHGFGSFCMAGKPMDSGPRLVDQRGVNPAFVLSEDEFVEYTLAGLGPYPTYYARMAPLNCAGPEAAELGALGTLGPDSDGVTFVDVREHADYAAGHLPGSLHLSASGSVATWLGWIVPIDEPIALVAANPNEAAAAQRDLQRIGFERIEGIRWPRDIVDPTVTRRASFADLPSASQSSQTVTVVDVRERSEWEDAHLSGSVSVPVHTLPDAELDFLGNGPVWVHCASGYRAGLAVSILERRGVRAVWIDDDFSNAVRCGLKVDDSEPTQNV